MFEIIGYIATCIAVTILAAQLVTKLVNCSRKDKYLYMNVNYWCGVDPSYYWVLIPTIKVSFGNILDIEFKFLVFYFDITYEFVTELKDDYLGDARSRYYQKILKDEPK